MIKIFQVFESYSLFYLPYIEPTLELLRQQDQVNSKVIVFKEISHSKDAFILPYHKRDLFIANSISCINVLKKIF